LPGRFVAGSGSCPGRNGSQFLLGQVSGKTAREEWGSITNVQLSELSILLFLAIVTLPGHVRADPVRIGVLTDLSGGMAFWGKQSRIGAELARDEIRSGGGDLELIFGDHQLQAKSAVTEFQKLADIESIDALYSEFTPTSVAIAPITTTEGEYASRTVSR
jgi:ABC-type branched-subunit amino acid transport system substrate-binding protein